MERLKKHISYQKNLFLLVFIGIGTYNLIYSFFSDITFKEAINTFFQFSILFYFPLAIISFICYLTFINGNILLMKFYYGYYIPFVSKIKKRNKKSIFYKFLNNNSILDHVDLIEESRLFVGKKNSYQKWVFSESNSNKPVFIRREHLNKSNFFSNWAFSNVVLLKNKLKLLKTNNNKYKLEVDLKNESYGIYNNAGKAFLKESFYTEEFKSECSAKNVKIQDFLRGKTTKNILEIDSKQFPLRWASGGVLPIVKYKDKLWFMLVFRGVNPIGWNIANGGSENKDEYKKITTLMLREFYEEFIICNRRPFVNDKRITRVKRFDPSNGIIDDLPVKQQQEIRSHKFQTKHFNLRKLHDGINLQESEEDQISLTKVDCPFSLQISYHDNNSKVKTKTISNVMLTFDFLQFGIECNSIYYFEMDDEDYPFFGEIWDVANCLIREPIMFLSVDFAKQEYSKNETIGKLKNDSFGCKIIDNITPNDIVIFDQDIQFKINRLNELKALKNKTKLEVKEIEFHEKWISSYYKAFKKNISPQDKLIRSLCPVSWKIIENFIRFNLDEKLK